MFKVKHVGECSFIFKSELAPTQTILNECVKFIHDHQNVGVFAPMIIFSDHTRIHNYRNFPSVLDLIIKNISFLRKKFPSKMRRFLLWDIRTDCISNVDFVTSDFLCVRNDLLDGCSDTQINANFFDLKLCAKAWQRNYEVCYNPLIKLETDVSFKTRSLYSKIIMLVSSLWLQVFLWISLKGVSFPSKNYSTTKQMLMNAHRINSRSFLSDVGDKFQKHNSVIQVFEGQVSGNVSYKQPLVFCYDGVIAVVKNSKQEYGLIRIWRHAPLKQSVPNLFPVFPDTQDLGIYSYECVRGGGEKHDATLETSILRELKEEINLTQDDIESIGSLSPIVGNTAWDVGRSYVFIVETKGDFDVKLQRSESIESFEFYSRAEILKMIQEKSIICGLTKAALLEDILAND